MVRTLLLMIAIADVYGQACPKGINTSCGPLQTCSPTFESLTGYGCCVEPNAVPCPVGPDNQMCCPSGTTCVPQGYAATCVPTAGGANTSGIHVCPPGAALPPAAGGGLPAVIVIGDSVSEGYQPVLAANLSAIAFVQHSPHSDGGGADDVAHGLACQENFLRTAMYAEAKWDLSKWLLCGRIGVMSN